jgi:hypothetical protein
MPPFKSGSSRKHGNSRIYNDDESGSSSSSSSDGTSSNSSSLKIRAAQEEDLTPFLSSPRSSLASRLPRGRLFHDASVRRQQTYPTLVKVKAAVSGRTRSNYKWPKHLNPWWPGGYSSVFDNTANLSKSSTPPRPSFRRRRGFATNNQKQRMDGKSRTISSSAAAAATPPPPLPPSAAAVAQLEPASLNPIIVMDRLHTKFTRAITRSSQQLAIVNPRVRNQGRDDKEAATPPPLVRRQHGGKGQEGVEGNEEKRMKQKNTCLLPKIKFQPNKSQKSRGGGGGGRPQRKSASNALSFIKSQCEAGYI